MSTSSKTATVAMPDQVAPLPEVPTDFRKPIIAGVVLMGLTLGGFGGWASIASLSSAVLTQGTVAVETKRKAVQHREGGIVDEVLVKEGQTVAVGTPLIRLRDASTQAQLETFRAQLDAKTAEQARLKAERDGLSAVWFPSSMLEQRSNPKVAEVINHEEDRFNQRRKSQAGQREILQSRIGQLEAQRLGRSMLEQSKRSQAELLASELEGLRTLTDKGFYPAMRLRAQERELTRLQGEMLADGASTSQTGKEISEVRLQMQQGDQKIREEVANELTRVENERSEIVQKLAAAQDTAERLHVVAPVSGVVHNLKVAGPGTVVSPSGEMMEVVPGDDRLIVEAKINARDIDRVHSGQDAELRFSAFGTRTTPIVKGEVIMVSADAITDEQTRQSYYSARIEVPPSQLSRLPRALKAGMPVEVMLQGGERTPLQYFLKPLSDSFARALKES